MTQSEIEKRLKKIQFKTESVARELEALRRDFRACAGRNVLRLEVEAIRKCVNDLPSDLDECFAEITG